jgi:hypothetical protein
VLYQVSRRYLPRTNVLETTARVRVVAVDGAGAHLDEQRVDRLEQAE